MVFTCTVDVLLYASLYSRMLSRFRSNVGALGVGGFAVKLGTFPLPGVC